MNSLMEMSVKDFIQLTGSDAPAPGGGSVAALAGALGSALSQMVAELTVGKEKYAASEAAMQQVRTEAAGLKQKLLEAMDRDSESFTSFMNAMGMPKATEEEKAARREAMQNSLKEAALVPLDVAEMAAEILPLAKMTAEQGNPNAVTDALVAAMMARSAVISAVLNVRINLLSIKDEEFNRKMAARADELVRLAIAGEREILAGNSLTADCL